MSPSFLFALCFVVFADSQLLRARRQWGGSLGSLGAAEVAREIQTEEAIREAETEAIIESVNPMGSMIGSPYGAPAISPYGPSMGAEVISPYGAFDSAQQPTNSFGRSRIVLGPEPARESPSGWSAVLENARKAGLP